MAPEKGCWGGMPEKCCEDCREQRKEHGECSEESFAAHLFPGTLPCSPCSTFQEFLSSTPFRQQPCNPSALEAEDLEL